METVFITIHDLSLDARIRYVSDSVEDILGYLPHEVKGKSCWEYFHPAEIPFARAIHGRGIQLDKAAMLQYCQIKHKDGSWIGCECVFTVVHDVLVASTSIYQRGPRSKRRANDAPAIRRIFSSSPRDPRYHMLSYMSTKFYHEISPHAHEPRAAMFLNRFTRTSTVMFATPGVANILGIGAEQLVGKSFYFCIEEGCLQEAVSCLESAKANDSIAYLRFWFRNPLEAENARDESMADATSDEDEDDGGVRIVRPEASAVAIQSSDPSHIGSQDDASPLPRPDAGSADTSRSSSENSANAQRPDPDGIFDFAAVESSRSSASSVDSADGRIPGLARIEVEACVSCSSDGLIVVLRRARPLVPQAFGSTEPVNYQSGVFAAPWALQPCGPEIAIGGGAPKVPDPPGAERKPAAVMSAIRDVAAFAWSLTGINGSIAELASGTPTGEAQPPGGLPIWDSTANAHAGDIFNGYSGSAHRPISIEQIDGLGHGLGRGLGHGPKCDLSGRGDSGSPMKEDSGKDKINDDSSSGDEIVWKRAPNIPEWRRPPRRAHRDAFGSDADGKDRDEHVSQSRRRRMDE